MAREPRAEAPALNQYEIDKRAALWREAVEQGNESRVLDIERELRALGAEPPRREKPADG